MDLFGTPPVAAPFTTTIQGAPASVNPMDLFGAPPPQPQIPSATTAMSNPITTAPVTGPVIIQGFSHQGLSVEFQCTKPDTWNKQKSVLVAQFKNTTDAPLYGLSMQVAVPKYVHMEMQPPTSTTVPQTGGNNKTVTQTITVTNSMLGTNNLMLKIKVGFTSKGTKVDHLATCSGFTAGEY
jgi:AP-1 complex subunit gamma-1